MNVIRLDEFAYEIEHEGVFAKASISEKKVADFFNSFSPEELRSYLMMEMTWYIWHMQGDEMIDERKFLRSQIHDWWLEHGWSDEKDPFYEVSLHVNYKKTWQIGDIVCKKGQFYKINNIFGYHTQWTLTPLTKKGEVDKRRKAITDIIRDWEYLKCSLNENVAVSI